jgi:flagellar hook-associated protein 1
VAELNPQIVQAQISGSTTSALVEQRNQALNALSKLVDLSVQDMPDGSVQLSTSGGLMLLDKSARRLDYSSPGTAAPETNFPQIRISRYDSNSGSWADSGFVLEQGLAGGEAKALVDLRDSELPNVADNLGELVRVFTDEVNRVHNNNVAVPAPSRLEGRNSGLTVSDPHHFTGKTTFAMVDSAGRITAKTTVDFSSIGSSMADVLSAINSGLGGAATATLNNGRLALQSNVTGQGIAMVDDPVDPANRGTRGFSHFFGLNDLINPPQPVHLDTGVTAADPHRFDAGGTMNLQVRDENNRVLASTIVTITPGTYQDILNQLNDPNGLGRYVNFSFDGDGRLNPQPNPGFRGLDVHVVSDSTSRGATQRNFTDYFGIGQGVLASAAQKLSIKADVKSNPSALALARLDPALNVGDFAIGPGDFRGAADLRDINLRDLDFRASGNLSSLKTSIANFNGFMLGDAALAANRADTGKTDSNALYESVQKRRDDFSGVNLDEELGNMVVFQNSYNASARLITTAREMYDILLGLVQ